MRGVNKIILIGTLGADPDVKLATNGNTIANLSVATSEEWNDRQTGQKQQKTEWHRVAVFGKLAEIAQQYLRKGSQVYIEGKLQTRNWKDQNGQDRYTTEIVISGFDGTMQMVGGRGRINDQRTKPETIHTPPDQSTSATTTNTYANTASGTPERPKPPGPPQPHFAGLPNQSIMQSSQSQKQPYYAPNDFDDDDVPF